MTGDILNISEEMLGRTFNESGKAFDSDTAATAEDFLNIKGEQISLSVITQKE